MDVVNILLAPFRMLFGIIEGLFYFFLLSIVGLLWPLIVYLSGNSVSFATFVTPILTIATLYALFKTTFYFWIVGGAIFACIWLNMIFTGELTHLVDGWNFAICYSIFLSIGFLLKYLMSDHEPKAKPIARIHLVK